jgi:hypothetical protein
MSSMAMAVQVAQEVAVPTRIGTIGVQTIQRETYGFTGGCQVSTAVIQRTWLATQSDGIAERRLNAVMRSHSSKRQSLIKPKIVFGLIGLAVLFVAIKVFWPKPSIADAAENYVRSAFAGSDREVVNSLFDHELRTLGWTREDASRFYREYLWPRLSKAKLVSVDKKGVLDNGAIGYVSYRFSIGSRGVFEKSTGLFFTEDGPKCLLRHLAEVAWYIDYCSRTKDPRDPLAGRRSAWRAIVRDRNELMNTFRFTKFVKEDPSEPVMNLADLLQQIPPNAPQD